MTDLQAAAQLSAQASLLTIAVPSLIAFNVIYATLALAVGLAAALLLDGLGWRIVAVMFDRERLITGTRSPWQIGSTPRLPDPWQASRPVRPENPWPVTRRWWGSQASAR